VDPPSVKLKEDNMKKKEVISSFGRKMKRLEKALAILFLVLQILLIFAKLVAILRA
jgi:cell division protein FtsL